jgi:hypothetical protein
MSFSKPTGYNFTENGLSLFREWPYAPGGLVDQNKKPIKFSEETRWWQEYAQSHGVAALAYLLGCPTAQFRGIMANLDEEESDLAHLGEHISVAYLLAWNAAKREKTRPAVFRFIREHWKPLFELIRTAQAGSTVQVWANQKWTEQCDLIDGLTEELIKAAASFFQTVHDAGVDEFDEETSDEETFDEETSDEETFDEETSDEEEEAKSETEEQRAQRLREEFVAFQARGKKRKQCGGSGESRKRVKPSSQDE